MTRHQCKNTVSNSQDNISPQEPSNPTKAGLEYYSIAEAQDKERQRERDIKTAFVNTKEVLKEEMNESLKEIDDNTNRGRE